MTEPGTIVHVVEDDDVVRAGIVRLLRRAGYEVCDYSSAGAFLLGGLQRNGPGCIVLDVHMPGPSGLELQGALARLEVALPIIFLSGQGDIPMSVQAMKAGAVDFLTKPAKPDALLGAVRAALARDTEMRLTRARARAFRERYASLTPREREVFAGIIAGKLNKQIAADLGTAERTVKAHRARVMEKMQAASVAELVHAAQELRESTAGV